MRVLIFVFFILFVGACKTDEKNNAGQTAAAKTDTPSVSARKNILFLGNSLTAGYGLDDPSAESYVALLQMTIDSLGLPYRCINAGISGETTAGGKERVEWTISQQPVDVFVLELGGNDALRGLDPKGSADNLAQIIKTVRAKYPSVKIVLAGMEAPRNMGESYIQKFHNIYPTLARELNVALVPFLLENVGGIATLNQKDGIHPTAEGNKIMAKTVWQTLKTVL